jgi:two-component system sensor histidine kinase RegB
MRIDVTPHSDTLTVDLRPAQEVAPSLALPWIAKLRLGLLVGLAILAILLDFVISSPVRVWWVVLPLAAMAASNLLVYRYPEVFGARHTLGSLLALDTICLTALLALTGGPSNPFTLLYLLQIVLSAVVLSKEWTWALGVLSTLCFGFLFRYHVPQPMLDMHHVHNGFSMHLVGMWIAFGSVALLITVFIGKVSDALRHREQEVLALREQLTRNEHLAAIATLAAGAAHELGTPLATIAILSRELERAELQGDNPDKAEEARLIRSEVERCRKILDRMSVRGGAAPGEALAVIQLDALLQRVKDGLGATLRSALRIRVDGSMAAVRLPVEATRQALAALVNNALDAGAPGSPVELSAEAVGNVLRFIVEDHGAGMSKEALQHIAEPFYTTKERTGGMGLGTFLVRMYATSVQGRLIFDSEPGVGTKAVLEVPLERNDR